MSNSKIPKTVDGQVIYPWMVVYECNPFSTVKAHRYTVYCVFGDPGYYQCMVTEKPPGDTICTNVLYADGDKCVEAAKKKYEEFKEELNKEWNNE